MKTVLQTVMASIVAVAAGCVQYTTPPLTTEPEKELTASEKNFQVLWLASQDVLRKYNFVIDRHDRRAGIMTTKPLTGQQFFEPWRKDAATQWDLWDGSIKTVHRSVTVHIQAKGPQAQWYEPVVEVTVSKPNAPRQQLRSAGEAYGMFILPTEEESENQHSILGYVNPPENAAQQEEQEHPKPEQLLRKDEPLAKKLTEEIAAVAARRLAEGRWQEE
jgi:hypothetical protein